MSSDEGFQQNLDTAQGVVSESSGLKERIRGGGGGGMSPIWNANPKDQERLSRCPILRPWSISSAVPDVLDEHNNEGENMSDFSALSH